MTVDMKLRRRSDGGGKKYMQGMTLIEMILVVSLIAMIGLSLFQALNNGLKIWQRSQQTTHDEDVIIFLQQLGFDLRNTVRYSLIKPEWQPESISWAAVMTTRMDRHISGQRIDYTQQIGRVEYYFDKGQHAIMRRQANYSQALKEKYGPAQQLVADVRQVRFSLTFAKQKNKDFLDSQEPLIPAALRIEFEIMEPNGHKRYIQRLYNIPLGMS